MRVLILGASGMLGHKLWQVFREDCEAYAALRGDISQYPCRDVFDPQRTIERLEAGNLPSLVEAFARVRPEVVVNAIGIVKQRAEAKEALPSLMINAVLPHRLAELCVACGARLMHLSTDCVFSGSSGGYVEEDPPDPPDLYGRSKLLGEVSEPPAITLRTSMIGREIGSRRGLVEWFLSQRDGKVQGFRRAIFSGLTTLELARVIKRLALEFPALTGLYHLAAEPISKFDLLRLIRDTYDLDISIEPDDKFACDRSLVGDRFRAATGYTTPCWPDMIAQMRDDATPYEAWSNDSDS